MDTLVFFEGAYPIGDTNVMALPVKEIGPAVAFYTRVLGFTLAERTENGAILTRNDARIGLEKNQSDPEQASVYFAVSDVNALHTEIAATGVEPTDIMPSQNDGKNYRVFFAKEPYGVCFCFGQAA